MKITREQIRRIVKEERSKILHETHPFGVEAAVDAAIKRYKSDEGQMQWNMARNEFQWMADGEHIPGVSDKYYKGWEPEDFQAVLDAVEGRR